MKSPLNKLQLDVLKRHVGPFIFCFFTLMFLLLMQFLILQIDNLVGKGLPFGIVVELIITNLAYMVVLAAPMAVLVSSLMAFGKFSELNELTAMRAAGVNPIRVINPVLAAAVLLCVFLIWFSNDVLPDANHRARSLFIDIRMKKPGFDLNPNEFYEGIDGYTFLVQDMDSDTDSLYNVTLFQERSANRKEAVIKADRGILESTGEENITLYLMDGSVMRKLNLKNKRTDMVEETHFDRYRISFDLSDMTFSRSNPDRRSRNDRTMSARAMLAVTDSLQEDIDEQFAKSMANQNNFTMPVETLSTYMPYKLENMENTSGIADTVAKVQTDYLVLNLMENRREQAAIRDIAVSDLRAYNANLDNLQTNVEWRVSKIAEYLVEVHKKYSIPFACLVFVLVGAPIGMLTRKGNLGYAALIGTGFLTFYWISLIQGEKLADRLFISPFTGMWFANIVLAVIGGYLVIRLCTSFRISNLWSNRDAQD
ncbi:MAG: LptF/LptG family permease [Balneolaceae bacterium]|nr:LptF/LptG family permease [Balneolaceae bacterium]